MRAACPGFPPVLAELLLHLDAKAAYLSVVETFRQAQLLAGLIARDLFFCRSM